MKIKLKPLAAALLSGIIASPALAVSNSSLQASVESLQKEVFYLKKQINEEHAASAPKDYHYQAYRRVAHVKRQQAQAETGEHIDPLPATDTGFQAPSSSMTDYYLPFDPDVPGQAFVTTGPYLGVRIQYAGTNLIVNSPSVNNDVQLLDIRKKIIQQLNIILGESRMKPTHSHLLFSGVIETQANYTDHGGAPSTTDIDVTNMSIDATIFGPNEWLLGLIELSYDGSPPNQSVYVSNSNYRVANSRVFVNKAFVTIGNFVYSPFYTTFGQFYVPFGVYSSVMVSEPLTRIVGRVKARSILVGYQQQATNAFYASAYIFRGDSHANSVAKVNNGGINVGYKFDAGKVKGNVGGGIISNLADSGGMQFGTNFQQYEQLVHRVPAYNLRGVLSFSDNIDVIAEYVGASRPFNPLDMSFNNHGAKPSAFDVEADYSFSILDNKPSSVGIGYSKSNQALAMGIPLTRTYVVFNTSLRRNTLQSLEFRHDRQYAASDVASGAGNVVVTPQNGKADNAVTAQFDYYF